MKYTHHDIKAVKVEEHLIKNQKMYFGSRGVNPEAICAAIAQGALTLGAKETNIREIDGWWYVSADTDWLAAPSKVKVSETTAFDAIHAFPEAGVNWHRSEIMAKTFSSCCLTKASDKPILVSGELPEASQLKDLSAHIGSWARTIVFKFRTKE